MRSLGSRRRSESWIAVAVVVISWVLLSVASYFLLATPRQQRFDFYPRWVGSRAALNRENPYSDEITWRIQVGMFGRRLGAGEDQQRYAYPAIIMWLLLPFWLLPFPLAISLWCGLQLVMLLILPIAVFSILGWRLRTATLTVILVFSVLVYRYPINAYLIGQFTPFCLTSLVVAWWGLSHRRPIVTGMAMIMAMIRPEITLLPVLCLLALLWGTGDRRVVWTWGAGIGGLLLLTRAWIGTWEADFARGLVAYQGYSAPIWPPSLFQQTELALLTSAAAFAWGAWMWREVRILDLSERAGWALSVSALVGLIVIPQTGNYNLIMGLVAAWIVLRMSGRRYYLWILVLALLSSPWWFLLGGQGLSSWEHLIIPVSLVALLTLAWRLHKGELLIPSMYDSLHPSSAGL